MLGLVLTIAACFAIELVMVQPDWLGVAIGFVPSLERLRETDALYLGCRPSSACRGSGMAAWAGCWYRAGWC
ncbi:hypothetical protein BH11PSE8_BH11PSE8_05660 [soil metagenome]